MKGKIINISKLSDIDTSKISVYDLNNRYIDAHGNIYGLKYNTGSKKIDIIKILRATDKEAAALRQLLARKKVGMMESNGSDETATSDMSSPEEEPREIFDADRFISTTISNMSTHRNRIKGVIMSIRNSNIIILEDKMESNELEQIFRDYEIDMEAMFDKVDNYQKELVNYPRSITYYQAKVDDNGRRIIEALAGNTERIMKFVYHYEMSTTIKEVYLHLKVIMGKLKDFMINKNIDEVKNATQHDKQLFQDANTSINNTMMEIDRLLTDIEHLEKYLSEPDHY